MMLIDLLILAALDCAIRPDAGERWAEFTCAEQLEREAYQKTQDCAHEQTK